LVDQDGFGRQLRDGFMRLIAFGLILLAVVAIGIAIAEDNSVPDGTIYGHVYEAKTKQPISQAWVYCQETECSKQTTDSEGYYAIESCFSSSSTYIIECTKNGYATTKNTTKTDSRGKAMVDFNLELTAASNLTHEKSWNETFVGGVAGGIISGKIINAVSHAPVSRAFIGIHDSNGCIYSGVADDNGYFSSTPVFHPFRGYDVICDTFSYTPVADYVVTDKNGNATLGRESLIGFNYVIWICQ